MIGIWWAIVIMLIALYAAFEYSGNIQAAKFTLVVLSAVSLCWVAYRIGQFRGMDIGRRIGGRPHYIQYALDEEHRDWETEGIEALSGSMPPTDDGGIGIPRGKTAERLTQAIANFPSRYPDYKSKSPKLDDDIRPWLKSAYGISDREAHVFGTIISEHFEL